MKTFEIRLAAHHSRNARHLDNLRRFIANRGRFDRLDSEDQSLLLEQVRLMADLDSLLAKRLRRLNIPV